jgi:hypothetical protein
MANEDKPLGTDPVEARLSELLSEMSEVEKRVFWKNWKNGRHANKRKSGNTPGNEFPFIPSVPVLMPISEITFKI